MNRFLVGIPLALAFLMNICGCSKPGPYRKETFPVKGRVLVDGQPVQNLAVICVLLSEADKEHPTESQCFTAKDGSFQIGTYESKDGVPEGEYVLIFKWGEWNVFSRSYDGDKLNGRYTDPKNSAVKFTVEDGPTELGEIKLTTI